MEKFTLTLSLLALTSMLPLPGLSQTAFKTCAKATPPSTSMFINRYGKTARIRQGAILPPAKLGDNNSEITSPALQTANIAAKASGEVKQLPYDQTFDNDSSLADFTIVDANDDGVTWRWNKDGYAAYASELMGDADDWLITPAISLPADGHFIHLYFTAQNGYYYNADSLTVSMGIGDDYKNYKVIIPTTAVRDSKPTVFEMDLKPEVAGNYHFAFYTNSNYLGVGLHLDNLHVTLGASQDAPDGVSDLALKAGAKGSLSASGSFTVPDKAISGSPLSSLTGIKVYRADSVLVHTYSTDEAVPGATLTFNDDGASEGFNTYRVIPSNNAGDGRNVTATLFVGTDAPLSPNNVSVSDIASGAHYNWEAPDSIGQNGGYVDPAGLTYDFGTHAWGGYIGEKLGSDLTMTSLDLNGNTAEGAQAVSFYSVQAKNDKGKSALADAPGFVTGKPYGLPLLYSVEEDTEDTPIWWTQESRSHTFYPDQDSQDDKGYSIAFASNDPYDECKFNSGKLDISKATHPVLDFWYYALPGIDSELDILVNPDQKDGFKLLKAIDYKQLTGDEGWRNVVIDLSTFKDSKYVILGFDALSKSGCAKIQFDNIKVYSKEDRNLSALPITVPKKARAGQPSTVTVNVINLGQEDAHNFTISLYADGTASDSCEVENLASKAEGSYKLTLTPAVNAADSILVYAVINYNDDEDTSDNASAAKYVTVQPSNLTPVPGLTGQNERGTVTLSWEKPDNNVAGPTVTDDFESYDSWLIDGIGDWTTFDGDGAMTGGFDESEFPHFQEPYAYIVMDPVDLGVDYDYVPEFKPHSGDKFMAALYSMDGTTYDFLPNDNWLISPVLSGQKQEVSFYVKSYMPDCPEEYEVLYSTTGTDTADFSVIKERATAAAEWENVKVTLPEGSRYFAIRHVTGENAFMFMVDDVTYQAGFADGGELEGFNVYRNGEEIAEMGPDDLAFQDNVPDGEYTYNVTAFYENGESPFSEPYTISVIDGIGTVKRISEANVDVYDLSGRKVATSREGLSRLHRGVYIMGGKKTVVK